MRTILLLLFLSVSISDFSQADTISAGRKDTSPLQQTVDSTNKYLKDIEQKEWEERNLAGLKLFLEQQNEHRKKEKQRGLIRIGVGVLFLLVLIIGLARKRKKTVS